MKTSQASHRLHADASSTSSFETSTRPGSRSATSTVTPGNIALAREELLRVAEKHLEALPEADRLVERMRVLGSPAGAGVADWLFRLEAESGAPVAERLLEFPLDGRWTFRSGRGEETVAIRGNADRIDLLANGQFRLIDYKTGRAPDRRLAIQLPVYAAAARQRLTGHAGRNWQPGEAAYIAFGERQPLVSLLRKGENIEAALLAGEGRFPEAIAGIEGGDFPPRPADSAWHPRDVWLRVRVPQGLCARSVSGRRTAGGRNGMNPPSGPEAGLPLFAGLAGVQEKDDPKSLPDAEARTFAVDPRNNVVLEASAGTGKTSVLVDRYLNLLDWRVYSAKCPRADVHPQGGGGNARAHHPRAGRRAGGESPDWDAAAGVTSGSPGATSRSAPSTPSVCRS